MRKNELIATVRRELEQYEAPGIVGWGLDVADDIPGRVVEISAVYGSTPELPEGEADCKWIPPGGTVHEIAGEMYGNTEIIYYLWEFEGEYTWLRLYKPLYSRAKLFMIERPPLWVWKRLSEKLGEVLDGDEVQKD